MSVDDALVCANEKQEKGRRVFRLIFMCVLFMKEKETQHKKKHKIPVATFFFVFFFNNLIPS